MVGSPAFGRGQAPVFFTSLGPTTTPGGFSGANFGTPGITGFGFPSFGDPRFFFMPAASSFNFNRLLGFANGSAVNTNFGPTPPNRGFGGLLLGSPFFGGQGSGGFPNLGTIGGAQGFSNFGGSGGFPGFPGGGTAIGVSPIQTIGQWPGGPVTRGGFVGNPTIMWGNSPKGFFEESQMIDSGPPIIRFGA